MRQESDTTTGGKRREFPTTQWNELVRLKDPSHPAYRAALERLIDLYWKPAYHYIRALRNISVDDAKDLTQQFFSHLLSNDALGSISAERGSFRGFLKTSLKNFLVSSERAKASRGPRDGARVYAFDEVEQEWINAHRTDAPVAPEEAFDQEWAREILCNAIVILRKSFDRERKATHFAIFQEYHRGLLEDIHIRENPEGNRREPPSYADLARRFGMSEDDIRNSLRFSRQKLRDILRDLLAEYVGPGGNVETELMGILLP